MVNPNALSVYYDTRSDMAFFVLQSTTARQQVLHVDSASRPAPLTQVSHRSSPSGVILPLALRGYV